MNNVTTDLRPVLSPTCPPWCHERDHDSDADPLATTVGAFHEADPQWVIGTDPTRAPIIEVNLVRHDADGGEGPPVVFFAAGSDPGIPLRLDDAERLAGLLLEVVARARSGAEVPQ